MKKHKNKNALVKEVLHVMVKDAVKCSIVEFEPTDSADLKVEYIYRLF